jgi:pilus assembly protein CpaC
MYREEKVKRNFRSLILPAVAFAFIFLAIKGAAIKAEEEEVLRLVLGENRSVATVLPSRVAIANPKIADVVNVTDKEIIITAKSPGVTSLVFWDSFGEQAMKIKVLPEDVDNLKSRVDSLLRSLKSSGVYTEAAEDEGRILLLGNVREAGEKERVLTALETLKDKVVDLIQIKEDETIVEIDVQVLELDKDATSTLGLTWPGSVTLTEQGSPALATTALSQVGNTTTVTGGAAIGTKWSTLFKVLNLSRNQFIFKLDALIQEGKARVLSRPRLACQSGKEAELLVGGEKPVMTTEVAATTGAQATKVEYKEFGIKLKMKPAVNEVGRIKLALDVDVSDVGTVETLGSTAAPTAKAYPLTKRSTSTELFLDDGQTLSLAGLIKQKTEEDIRKVPWLGDIPVLGTFFRQKTSRSGGGTGERGDTELFITLTPTIVHTDNQAIRGIKAVARPAPQRERENITTAELDALANGPEFAYSRLVQSRIMDNLAYPAQAKAAGLEGTVRLKLRLTYLGQLIDASIKNSSGFHILDDNALEVARQVSSYPPFPASVEQKELWIEIPIVYRLD